MRRFYVRRKDLSPFPLQFYYDRDGVERRLEPGHTFTFAVEPPKDQFAFLHIHILDDFARLAEESWDIAEADLIRIAAKAFEAWLKGEAIPEDHFNGTDLLEIDAAWYPQGPDQAPALAANPYRFEVITDEAWPTDSGWPFAIPADSSQESPVSTTATQPTSSCRKTIVFGYTLDCLPGLLIVGYNQFKHKVAEAGLNVAVKMLPLNDLPPQVDVLFVPQEFAEAARKAAPHSRVEVLGTFLNHPSYNTLIQQLMGESEQP